MWDNWKMNSNSRCKVEIIHGLVQCVTEAKYILDATLLLLNLIKPCWDFTVEMESNCTSVTANSILKMKTTYMGLPYSLLQRNMQFVQRFWVSTYILPKSPLHLNLLIFFVLFSPTFGKSYFTFYVCIYVWHL